MRRPLLAVALVVSAVLSGTASAAADPPDPAAAAPPLTGDLVVHDPALVKGEGGEDWFVFSTGAPEIGDGTPMIRSSRDGQDWTYRGTVWDTKPAWLSEAVPGVTNLWAPEVYEHDDTFYLYYSASTFGSNDSVIALATNTTLDPDDPAYEWVDRGPVISSTTADDFNAIDPGIVEDADGRPWMAFGSFWSGIRMVPLQWPSGTAAPSGAEPLRLADRRVPPNAVEAPYIVERGGWYYLFVSFDSCCRGVDSTYRIMIGRSRAVTGPYVDRAGTDLRAGGGTELLATSGTRVGPGGQSVSGGILAHHFYDATADGEQRLALRELSWTPDGWPELRAGR